MCVAVWVVVGRAESRSSGPPHSLESQSAVLQACSVLLNRVHCPLYLGSQVVSDIKSWITRETWQWWQGFVSSSVGSTWCQSDNSIDPPPSTTAAAPSCLSSPAATQLTIDKDCRAVNSEWQQLGADSSLASFSIPLSQLVVAATTAVTPAPLQWPGAVAARPACQRSSGRTFFVSRLPGQQPGFY